VTGDGCDQHCVASHAVLKSENGTSVRAEGPANGGFRELAGGLQPPDFTIHEANSPKVSGHYREYSRFRETDAGDRGSIATA
jgi:hypothetical protein